MTAKRRPKQTESPKPEPRLPSVFTFSNAPPSLIEKYTSRKPLRRPKPRP
jgi:hypothetical protein